MSATCVGLMAGTSLDGIDVAVCQIDGHARDAHIDVLAFETVPYPAHVRSELLAMYESPADALARACSMNVVIGRCFGEAAQSVLSSAGVDPTHIDVIGSHGQTIWHQAEDDANDPLRVRSTLQIGEASEIAARVGAPVMADFRVADIAVGGLGAPLAPYADWALFTDVSRNRAIQNIGGIGNVTWLPASAAVDDVIAFDTGPGNMLIDALVARLTDGEQAFDRDADIARSGVVNEALLSDLMRDAYLMLAPPKTTGRERYGSAMVEQIISTAGLNADVIATVTAFTAESIADAYRRWLPTMPDEVFVNGGGARNPLVMERLASALGVPVQVTDELGVSADAKEAVLFALLAHDALAGLPTNVPGATGASRAIPMGKLTRL